MEYMIHRESNGKNKAREDQTEKKIVSCIEVLTKDCISELVEKIDKGFTKLSSEIFDLKTKLKLLDENFKNLQKLSKTTKKDLKTSFVTVDSSDSSIEFLSITPSKECNKRKMNKNDIKIGVGMRKNRKIVQSHTYDPFAVADQNKVDWLESWMKIDRYITVNLGTIKADKQFFYELLEPRIWLSEDHIDVGMSLLRKKLAKVSCPFRTERLAFLDVPFTMIISKSYQKFLENPKKFAWSNGFVEYYNGVLPRCGRTNKKFGVDVDDVYVVLNIKNVHWIALAISIRYRNIEVYDSIISLSTDDEIEEFVKPYALMFPYLINSLVSTDIKDALGTTEYTITRCEHAPQNKQSGDCGVYAMKYIECLALDIDMESELCDAKIKDIRQKLATDIFVEGDHLEDL